MRSLQIRLWLLVVGFFATALPCTSAWCDESELATAHRLLLTGRYAEAAETYEKFEDDNEVAPAIGISRCLASEANQDEAQKELESAVDDHPQSSDLHAELALLALDRGDHSSAAKHVERSLAADPDQTAARWVQAELDRTSGELKKAEAAYKWFVDYYNKTDSVENPDELRYIGMAAAHFARWNRLHDQFNFLVNDLLPAALAKEENYWPAYYESGRLFLEKYNQAQAQKDLQAALTINPNSADVHAALAELAIVGFDLEQAKRLVARALEINPNHLHSKLMLADIHVANLAPRDALEVLEKARELNRVSEPLLGRLAAVYGLIDEGKGGKDHSRRDALVAEVLERNPHAGGFFFAMAGTYDKARKFPEAERAFARATEVMPQMVGPRGQRGLMLMRLADEPAARKLLEASFDRDPFNVRVSNSIKVLEVLDEYATIETEHFVIRYDKAKDAVLAQYVAEYLEEIHPELCERLDFEPPEKSLFELFNHARNTDGHGWFSARMVGLPQIHTIGACAGKMVALTSPTSMKQRFNWARVLRHEFVHVINLQQTNFNIPHWFTEALAVHIEDTPRPQEWNEMLARRVPSGETFNLDTINQAFIRPQSSEDWQMAYCQSEIYAEYMIEKYGQDSIGKMLAAYHDNLGTGEAIRHVFGITQEEFERGYAKQLKKIVADLSPGETEKPMSFAALRAAHAKDPDDAELASELAVQHLRRKEYAEAGKLADAVLEDDASHQRATYVKARLIMLIGQNEQAFGMLEKALNRDAPEENLVRLLAGLKYRSENYTAAEELFSIAADAFPKDLGWRKSLAMVHLKTGNDEKLAEVLRLLAEADYDDLTLRKKLAQLALKRKDFSEATKWATECIQIDVLDADCHQMLAEAHAGRQEYGKAVEEYEVAVELSPKEPRLWMKLAQVAKAANQNDIARNALTELLRLEPEHPGAAELLESLGP